jgi:hypothetical protein
MIIIMIRLEPGLELSPNRLEQIRLVAGWARGVRAQSSSRIFEPVRLVSITTPNCLIVLVGFTLNDLALLSIIKVGNVSKGLVLFLLLSGRQ